MKQLFILVALAIMISSCTTAAYNYIGKHSPETTKDTSNLVTRSTRTFPVDKSVFKEGVFVVDTILRYDTTKILNLNDSVNSIIAQIWNLRLTSDSDALTNVRIIDSLKSKLKHAIGHSCGTDIAISSIRTDTSYNQTPAEAFAEAAIKINNETLNQQHIQDAQMITDTKSDKDKYFWLFVGASVLFGVSNGLWIYSKLKKS